MRMQRAESLVAIVVVFKPSSLAEATNCKRLQPNRSANVRLDNPIRSQPFNKVRRMANRTNYDYPLQNSMALKQEQDQ